MKHKAIVFNCRYNGLSIIQELSRNGVECVAMDCYRGEIGTFSRYASYIKCPDPRYEEENFIEQLIEYCKKEKEKPVLFPTNDEWVLAVSRHKKRLSEYAYVCAGSFDVVGLFLNKERFYETGQAELFMTPKIWTADQSEKIDDEDFPVVAKPKFKSLPEGGSKEINNRLVNNRLVFLKNRNELDNYLSKIKNILPYIIFQPYVNGVSDSMYTVGIYADEKSKIRALFTGRKVRGYPAEYGDNIVGESCEVPEKLIYNTQKIIAKTGYSGIAEFEYKKDSVTGQYYLIEINPRSWSWIGITPFCGVNIPLVAYLDLTGLDKNRTELHQKEERIRYIKVYHDFMNCMFRYGNSYPDWKMSFRDWYRNFKKQENIIAEVAYRDYPVAIMSIFCFLAESISQRKR